VARTRARSPALEAPYVHQQQSLQPRGRVSRPCLQLARSDARVMIRFRSNTPPIALPAPLVVVACGRVQARAMIGPEARARGERRAPSSTPLPMEPDLAGKPTRWKPWPRARWPRRTLTPAPDRAAAAGGRCPPEPASRRRTQARTYERTAAGTYVPGSQRQLSRSAAYVMSTFTASKSSSRRFNARVKRHSSHPLRHACDGLGQRKRRRCPLAAVSQWYSFERAVWSRARPDGGGAYD
jgi:hypothetical protein